MATSKPIKLLKLPPVPKLPPYDPNDPFGVDAAHRVDLAIDELRRIWQLGDDSIHKTSADPLARHGLKSKEAQRLGISVEWLRKIRQFAERCGREELEKFISEARQHGYALRPCSLMAIFEIRSQSARQSLWKSAVQQHMSRREILATARAAKLTPAVRQAGSGRRVKLPHDASAARQFVLEQSRLWLSIMDAAEGIVKLSAGKRRAFQGIRHAMKAFLKNLS